MKIFPWFPGFRICSMAKNENPEMLEINRKLCNSKKHQVNLLLLLENCQKAVTLLFKYNFGFNNKKATFKLKW